jgi:hypothetical protein
MTIAYEMGADAKRNCLPVGSCPHRLDWPSQRQDAVDWRRGWSDVQTDRVREDKPAWPSDAKFRMGARSGVAESSAGIAHMRLDTLSRAISRPVQCKFIQRRRSKRGPRQTRRLRNALRFLAPPS